MYSCEIPGGESFSKTVAAVVYHLKWPELSVILKFGIQQCLEVSIQ